MKHMLLLLEQTNTGELSGIIEAHHTYSHIGNVGNECADHAAALGAQGLVS